MEPNQPDSRRKILDAARDVFADTGFRGGTIGAIANAAGVNRALIYYYFDSKEDIYRALLENGLAAFHDLFAQLPPEDAPVRERLHAFVRPYIGLCFDAGGLSRMVRRELVAADVGIDMVAAPFRDILQRLAGILAAGIDSGQLRPIDPMAAAWSLLGMMNITQEVALLTDEPIDPDSAAARALDLFLNGMQAR